MALTPLNAPAVFSCGSVKSLHAPVVFCSQGIGYYGVVRDYSGNPAERRVTLLDDATGALVNSVLSDPVTGAYAIPATAAPHTLVFSGEPGRNALVFAAVMPDEIPGA